MNTENKKDKTTFRVLALMEATTVTGPAKNLIEFSRRARLPGNSDDMTTAEVSFVTFRRGAEESHNDDDASHEGGPAPNAFVAAARAAGARVYVIPERFRFDPRVLSQLRQLVELHRPDIIQTHQVKSHFLLKLSGLWRRHPWIAFHHGYTTTDLKMELYNRLNRWSLPAARRVVTVCGAFSPRLTREGVSPEKIFVRHNSISPNGNAAPPVEEVSALRERLNIREGARVILAVGRLSREKGHADLVRALGHLRASEPAIDFRLLVVGDGPEREAVETEARAQGVADRLVFAGHVSDVRPFYALADVLALPSHSEGSPNVLLEAMAAGLPVAATSVGGVPEIVSDEESALLVAPHDAAALGAALARLLKDEDLARRLASNARALVAAHYTPDAYARSLIELYREVSRE
ncbi:MAG TPA: glycosyltransferase family 4 protein [Pyrinomonadaceae bacterium]|nr:glycosyltransferase family 4 protein [Pyrinomonadaceae bacterium]